VIDTQTPQPATPGGSEATTLTHHYTIIDHTADTGIETRGTTLAEAIGNAAFAMFDLMYDLSTMPATMSISFDLTADSPSDLLVDVLSELLLRSENDDIVFSDFRVHEAAMRATVEASGSSAVNEELRGPPIKAVTYHGLRCEPAGAGWEIRVIFDV
jgi:SHS2 domain-containing protein